MNKSLSKRFTTAVVAGIIIAGNIDFSVLAEPINTLSTEKRQAIFQAHNWEGKNGDGIVVTDNGPDFTSVGGTFIEGNSLIYNDVDFGNGELNTMLVTLAALSKDDNKEIQVRLDSAEGEIIGTIKVDSSNDMRVFKEHYVDILNVTGVHDVALVFSSDMNVDIDWFTFSEYNGTESEAEFDERMQWFRDAKYGQFIHFGAYSEAGGEYKGKRTQYAEWLMINLGISKEDYANDIAKEFNPTEFDAEEIVSLAKDAGQKYMVFTSRHHEGFSMYDTEIREFKDYELMSYANYKGKDPLEELAKECKKQDIKFGAYYTIYDWHDKSQSNYGDKIDPAQKEEYKTRMKGQLRELIEEYDVEMLWFDGEWPSWWTKEDGQEVYRYLRTIKPSILVNNRVGKRHEDDGDFGTPEQEIPSGGLNYDWESCMTLNNTWGYNKYDNNWKSPNTVIENLVDTTSKGGNYLLNVGPDDLGSVPKGSADVLREAGTWLSEYGDSIYGTNRTCFNKLPNGVRATTKDGKIYLHVTKWQPENIIKIPKLVNEINSMNIMGTDIDVNFTDMKDGISIETPDYKGNKYDTVIEIDVEGIPQQVESEINVNLATKATDVVASNYYRNDTKYSGKKAVDGDESTRWATDDNTKQATLDLTFAEPITFNKASFKNFISGTNKVNGYNIEYWNGEEWIVGYTGGLIDTTSEVMFDPITADKVRLNITNGSNPSIYEFQLFNEEVTSVEILSPTASKVLSADGFKIEGKAEGGESVELVIKSNDLVPVTYTSLVDENGNWSADVKDIGGGTKNIRVNLKDSDGNIVAVNSSVFKVRDYGKNLVAGKPVTVSSEYTELPGYNSTKALDEDLSTRWAPNNGDKTPTMTVDLGQMTKFDTVIISEMLDTWVTPNQYRCLKFKVEYYDGNKCGVINEGTTIGEELTINFDPVTGSKIKLTVLENTPNNNYAPANIVEFEVYNTKKDEVVENIKKVTNLKVIEKYGNSVKLSWEAPKEGTEVAEYIIYKDGKEIDTVKSGEKLEYEAKNLRSNTNYGFKVASKGTRGAIGKPVSVNVRTVKK